MSDNTETIKRFYDSFRTKDKESYLSLCSDNIEWYVMGGMPGGGAFIGKKAVFEEYFPKMLSNFREFHAITEEFFDAHENVIVTGKYEGVAKSTGRKFTAKFAHIYTLRNSKIVKFRQYADTKAIHDSL